MQALCYIYFMTIPKQERFRQIGALPGVDLISGHYGLIVPPSQFNGGSQPYRWQNSKNPCTYPYHLLKDKTEKGDVKDFVQEVFPEGMRNDSLTKLAGHYFAEGYNYSEAERLLIADNFTRCEKPLSIVEVKTICGSIYQADVNQKEEAARPLKQMIEDYIEDVEGVFTVQDIDNEFELRSKEEKSNRRTILSRLVKNGIIKKYGKKSGMYRKVTQELNYMNIFDAKAQTIFLPLPLGLSEMVAPFPKNIVVCAGSSNAGKTTLAMDLAHKILNYKAQELKNTRKFETYVVSKTQGKPLSVLLNEQINGLSEPINILYFTSEMGQK